MFPVHRIYLGGTLPVPNAKQQLSLARKELFSIFGNVDFFQNSHLYGGEFGRKCSLTAKMVNLWSFIYTGKITSLIRPQLIRNAALQLTKVFG